MNPDPRIEVAAEALHLDYCREARCAGPEPDDYNVARAVVAALDALDAALVADLRALCGRWDRPDHANYILVDAVRAVLDRHAPEETT